MRFCGSQHSGMCCLHHGWGQQPEQQGSLPEGLQQQTLCQSSDTKGSWITYSLLSLLSPNYDCIFYFFVICRDYYNCMEILYLLCAYLSFDDLCIVLATSPLITSAWFFSKSFKATLINWIWNREHLRCLVETFRLNLNCTLRNERQCPKDFFKFNFKASQVYFILIDLKKWSIFYCWYIPLLDIFSLHR